MTRSTKSQARAIATQAQYSFAAQPASTFSDARETSSISISLRPMGAVRQTKKDTWDPSEAVTRYRLWRDQLRDLCGVSYGKNGRLKIDTRWKDADEVKVMAYFSTSLSNLWGLYYKETPDCDNVWKAVTDALFVNDKGIAVCYCKEVWSEHDGMDIVIVNGLR